MSFDVQHEWISGLTPIINANSYMTPSSSNFVLDFVYTRGTQVTRAHSKHWMCQDETNSILHNSMPMSSISDYPLLWVKFYAWLRLWCLRVAISTIQRDMCKSDGKNFKFQLLIEVSWLVNLWEIKLQSLGHISSPVNRCQGLETFTCLCADLGKATNSEPSWNHKRPIQWKCLDNVW